MAITYELAPNPKWYIADLTGKPLGGGYIATYSSLNKTVIKIVYQDPAGLNAWPYITIPNTGLVGILFDENGSQGPFYWKVDSANPNDTYFIEVFDFDGVLQWTVDNFGPSGGGGGGGTTILSLDNLVTNNVMYRNIGTVTPPVVASPVTPYSVMLAPGAHQGFTEIKDVPATNFRANPDIWFFKNNSSATDSLTFTNFALSGTSLNGDVTPVEYLNYTCTGAGTSETMKYVQFPITQNAYNLQNQAAKLTIWAKSASTSTITLKWLQFFGDGAGATTPANSVIQAIPLLTTWQQLSVTANIPMLPSPLVYGGCGNSGLFLQVWYPTDTTCNIDFTKPAPYLGTVAPTVEYQTYDMISAIIDSPKTGDIKTTLDHSWLSSGHVCPYGWVEMNDGTIGSATSGATTRSNIDTFPLYNLIWNNVSRTWAPIVGATTGTAIGDYTANLPLRLTRALGRVFAGTINSNVASTFTAATPLLTVASTTSYPTGAPVVLTTTGTLPTNLSLLTTYYVINISATTMSLATTFENAISGSAIAFVGAGTGVHTVTITPYVLGEAVGSEVITDTALAAHSHVVLVPGSDSLHSPTTPYHSFSGSPNSVAAGGNISLTTSTTGAGAAAGNQPPTTYMNVYIKL